MSNRLETAKKYHGWSEILNRAELNKLLGVDPRTTAWCAAFVNYIEKKCGSTGTGRLNARSYLKYGTPVSDPQPGDIVVFKRGLSNWQGHVAYYVQTDANGVLVLGGNQGDKVCYKYYPKNKVLGYRRP